jgi:hypothetical protein
METLDDAVSVDAETVETDEAVEDTTEEQEVVPVAKEKLIYVGPNMGGELPMTRFRIYSGGLPKFVQARCDEDEAFAKLFVPVADLAVARLQIENKTSVLGKAYQAVIAAYQASRKGGKS